MLGVGGDAGEGDLAAGGENAGLRGVSGYIHVGRKCQFSHFRLGVAVSAVLYVHGGLTGMSAFSSESPTNLTATRSALARASDGFDAGLAQLRSTRLLSTPKSPTDEANGGGPVNGPVNDSADRSFATIAPLDSDPPAEESEAMPTRARLLAGLIATGMLTRIVIIAVTTGSNDMRTWTRFAETIRSEGMWALYDGDVLFNHPPIVGMTAAALNWVAEATGIPFEYLFKLPMLIGDFFVLWLLWTIWSTRSRQKTLMAMALFACNPISILATAHHGNTDSLVAALVLLAARQHSRNAMFTAGLALAVAGNVKIVVGLCIPALLLLIRERVQLQRIIAGGAVGAIPFAIAAAAYESVGRLIILVTMIVFAVLGRRRDWSPYKAAALAFASFLVVTAGWGIQYTVWLVPVLAAASITWSARYAAIVGAFVILLYGEYVVWEFPIRTWHNGQPEPITAVVGLVAWVWMIWWMIAELRNKAKPSW